MEAKMGDPCLPALLPSLLDICAIYDIHRYHSYPVSHMESCRKYCMLSCTIIRFDLKKHDPVVDRPTIKRSISLHYDALYRFLF